MSRALQEFMPVAHDFEEHKWTRFTPHYLVWVCPDSYHKSDECKSQCIRQGRYCTPDPDGNIEKGYSGRDVVQVRDWAICLRIASHPEGLSQESFDDAADVAVSGLVHSRTC